jgi:hypothetical protein
LADLVTRIEEAPALTVVVFDSAKSRPTAWRTGICADRARVTSMPPSPTGQHPYVDDLIGLSACGDDCSIRGRVRGAGSEFVLATDMRFAGDEAILEQFEVGLGVVPGGGSSGGGQR